MENFSFPLIFLLFFGSPTHHVTGGSISMFDNDDGTEISIDNDMPSFGNPQEDSFERGGGENFGLGIVGQNPEYGGYIPYGYRDDNFVQNPYFGGPSYQNNFGKEEFLGGFEEEQVGQDLQNQLDSYGGYPTPGDDLSSFNRNTDEDLEGTGNNFPPVACPAIFKYMYDPKYGGYFGYISIPRPQGEIKYDAEINMTINRPVSQQDNIKLQLMSTANDIYYGDTLHWAVKFPYQDMLPKLTQIRFNRMVICSNYPDPLIPGVTQSSMWAKSSISTGKKLNDRLKRKKKRKKKKRNMKGRRKVPIGAPSDSYTNSFNPYTGVSQSSQADSYADLPGGPIDATGNWNAQSSYGY